MRSSPTKGGTQARAGVDSLRVWPRELPSRTCAGGSRSRQFENSEGRVRVEFCDCAWSLRARRPGGGRYRMVVRGVRAWFVCSSPRSSPCRATPQNSQRRDVMGTMSARVHPRASPGRMEESVPKIPRATMPLSLCWTRGSSAWLLRPWATTRGAEVAVCRRGASVLRAANV